MRKYRRARERIKKDKLARKMKIYNRYGIYNMDVSAFMQRFHSSENINEVFSCGCCYWFAKILFDRFSMTHGAIIMYDEVANHFGTKIDDVVYDITGDVTSEYQWKPWSDVSDSLLRARIIRDCIMF